MAAQQKKEVCVSVLSNDAADGEPPQELEAHFNRLPTRYALYVHNDREDDVLTHKRLLEEIRASEHKEKPTFHVRAVPTLPNVHEGADDEVVGDPVTISKLSRLQLPTHNFSQPSTDHEAGSSSSEFKSSYTEALNDTDNYASDNDSQSSSTNCTASNVPVHEVTIASVDKPKLLSLLSAMLADIGLNIREAHVFSTTDGFSLNVFVVDGWPTQDVEDMNQAILQALSAMQADSASEHDLSLNDPSQLDQVQILETTNDWEIDSAQLKFIRKVTTGSCGDLYQGSYCGQDVAIKVIKSKQMNKIMRREFQQEVYIMRKVRHKNIVQFIGACTKSPNFCIVTEYMSGGSVYDYLHQQKKAVLKMPRLLKVAIDVSKGMDYLHQNHILHRDLKAANLLMDENEVVKVADFGVARVQAQSGIMTAETGTYRWMAPEVIEHKPYDTKADVFSFGVVLWELLTGKVPYADLTPLQAAVGVVRKGLRPTIHKNVDPRLSELLQRCWKTNSTERPDFSEITGLLEEILKQVNQAGLEVATKKYKDKHLAGLFTSFKRSPIRG